MAKAKHPAMTEAEIQQRIANDPDAPEATDEQLAQARPFAEAFPELAASIRRGRGPGLKPKKEAVTLRLDPDIVAHFKGTGEGWQTRINKLLRITIEAEGAAASKSGGKKRLVMRTLSGRIARPRRHTTTKKTA